jgi:hypothetical protein
MINPVWGAAGERMPIDPILPAVGNAVRQQVQQGGLAQPEGPSTAQASRLAYSRNPGIPALSAGIGIDLMRSFFNHKRNELWEEVRITES